MSVIFITNEAPPRPGGAGIIGERVASFHGYYKICPSFTNVLAFSKGLKFARYLWFLELLVRCICSAKMIKGANRVVLNDFGAALIYYLAGPLFRKKDAVYIFHGLLEESTSRFISFKKFILIRVLSRRCIETLYVSDSIRRVAMSADYPPGEFGHFGFYLQRNCLRTSKQWPVQRKELRFFFAGRINQRKFPVEALDFLVEVARQSGRRVLVSFAGAWSAHLDEIQGCSTQFKEHIDIEHLGYLTSVEINTEMSACDFVFNPSTYVEAAPTVAYEAALIGAGYVYRVGDSHVELGVYNSGPSIGIVDFSPEEATRFVELISQRNPIIRCFCKTMEPVEVLRDA